MRVLQEMIAAGWSNPEIAARGAAACSPAGTSCSPRWPPRRPSASAGSARSRRPRSPRSSATPSSGREALLLLGFDRHALPIRASLRRRRRGHRCRGAVRGGGVDEGPATATPTGHAERDGVKVGYEVFGEGNEPTLLLMPTWSIVHPDCGRDRSAIWLATTASSRTTGGAGGLDRAGRYPRRTPTWSTSRTPSRCWTPPAPTGRFWSGSREGGLWSLLLASRHPDCDCKAHASIRRGGAASARWRHKAAGRAGGKADRPVRGRARLNTEGLGQVQLGITGCGDYERLPAVLLPLRSSSSLTRRSRSKIPSAGALETDPAVLADTSRGASTAAERRRSAERVQRVRCPVLVVHGDNDSGLL